MDIVLRGSGLEKSRKAIKKDWDNLLKSYDASELIISLGNRNVVSPYLIVLKDKVSIDTDKLVREFPKVAAKVAVVRTTTSLRVRIIQGGTTIRT